MIPNIQISGAPDPHPEKPVYDASELAAGKVDLTGLAVTKHQVKVFNLMDDLERKNYEELYLDLIQKSKAGKILISSNVRETLHNSDGSTGWYKFIEWTEFDTSEILGA